MKKQDNLKTELEDLLNSVDDHMPPNTGHDRWGDGYRTGMRNLRDSIKALLSQHHTSTTH